MGAGWLIVTLSRVTVRKPAPMGCDLTHCQPDACCYSVNNDVLAQACILVGQWLFLAKA